MDEIDQESRLPVTGGRADEEEATIEAAEEEVIQAGA
jgi:hypothetical protein